MASWNYGDIKYFYPLTGQSNTTWLGICIQHYHLGVIGPLCLAQSEISVLRLPLLSGSVPPTQRRPPMCLPHLTLQVYFLGLVLGSWSKPYPPRAAESWQSPPGKTKIQDAIHVHPHRSIHVYYTMGLYRYTASIHATL